jgi:hypothetical protein
VIASLPVPFADARASDLCLVLDGEAPPALAERQVRVGPFLVCLRILGGSHQVVVRGAGLELSEVVACGSAAAGALPRERRRAGYRFRSRLLRPGAARLDELTRAAAARAARDPLGLAGVFPGRRGSVTALVARPRAAGVEWWTWHAYPEAGEAVLTVSRVEPAG